MDELKIPEGMYCYDGDYCCPYWSMRDDKPEQDNGYCSFLKTGDWEHPGVGLLWDQVKECGVNENWDKELKDATPLV